MLLAALLFALLGALVKLAARGGVPAAEITFVRFGAGLATCLVLACAGVIRLQFRRWWLLTVRGLFGSVSALLFFLSVTQTSLGRATLLCYTYVIFSTLFSALVLQERLRLGSGMALAVAMAGVALVIQPRMTGVNHGDLIALLSGVLGGIAITSIRELRKTESAYAIFTVFCAFGVFTSLAMARQPWVAPHGPALLPLVGVALLATSGQLLMTAAYRHCSAALGGLLSLVTVVVASGIGLVFFGETIGLITVAGSALVLGAAAYLTISESVGGPPMVEHGGDGHARRSVVQ